MDVTQSFKIYEILQRHFDNDADAKAVVAEIEQIIEAKIEAKKNALATKEDIYALREATKENIYALREDTKKDIYALKEDIARLEVKIEHRFNNIIMWLIGTGIGIVGLIFTVIKLFIVS